VGSGVGDGDSQETETGAVQDDGKCVGKMASPGLMCLMAVHLSLIQNGFVVCYVFLTHVDRYSSSYLGFPRALE